VAIRADHLALGELFLNDGSRVARDPEEGNAGERGRARQVVEIECSRMRVVSAVSATAGQLDVIQPLTLRQALDIMTPVGTG
jgi:hypothetical protein